MYRDMSGKRKHLINKYGNACKFCGYTGMLEVHHIIPVCDGGTNDLDNLILLCELCHCEAHGAKKKIFLDKEREFWKPQCEMQTA